MAASVTKPPRGRVDGVLEIEVERRPGTIVVALAGEWDLAARSRVAESLRGALEQRPDRFVLDLSRLTFIDSIGLDAAVELQQQATDESIELAIIPGPAAVQRPFEICRLTESLPFTSPGQTPA